MLKLRDILGPHEAIALGAALTLAAGIYLALIHPSLRLVGLEEEAAARRSSAEKQLAQLRIEYQQLQTRLADHQRRLHELGGSPPLASEKDRQIARITALAHACGVKVDQFSPIETIERRDHQEALLQFGGRAAYASVLEFFRRIESEIDFVDVTHFAIGKSPEAGAVECQIQWSCRITGMKPPEPLRQEDSAVKPQTARAWVRDGPALTEGSGR